MINQYAADDALFCADDGTPVVWAIRLLEVNGKRQIFGSLLHGTMAPWHHGDSPPECIGTTKGVSRPSGDRHVRRRWHLADAVSPKRRISVAIFLFAGFYCRDWRRHGRVSPSGSGNANIAGGGVLQSTIRLNAVARALEFAMAGSKAVADHQRHAQRDNERPQLLRFIQRLPARAVARPRACGYGQASNKPQELPSLRNRRG
ncbi:hypothetical protein [Paraburkholderia phytofirmans]